MGTYHITVGGDRLKTIQVGKIARNSGFTVLEEERGETLAKRGEFMFPNVCEIWGARAINGKIPDADKPIVNLTDPAYKGEVIGLKWGDKRGAPIKVRFLRAIPSLDLLYQEKVLNVRINEDDESSAEAFFIQLPNGDNDFNEDENPLLVQHLKWHTYNFNSISRNPSFYTTAFREKNFEQQERVDTKSWNDEFEAMKVVMENGEGVDSLSKLKNLFVIVREPNDEEPDDNHIYAYLKMVSKKRPEQFLQKINDFKVKVSNIFAKMDSYEIADTTTDGKLVVEETISKGRKQQQIILTDLPCKGKEIYDYMLTNYTDPKIYEAIQKLIQITDKIN